ncbi:MAG: hypothetical protein WCC65_12665, partial [Pseudonocardiaceae bacterium]
RPEVAVRAGRALVQSDRPEVGVVVRAGPEPTAWECLPGQAEQAVVRGVCGAGGRVRPAVVRVWLRAERQRAYRILSNSLVRLRRRCR